MKQEASLLQKLRNVIDGVKEARKLQRKKSDYVDPTVIPTSTGYYTLRMIYDSGEAMVGIESSIDENKGYLIRYGAFLHHVERTRGKPAMEQFAHHFSSTHFSVMSIDKDGQTQFRFPLENEAIETAEAVMNHQLSSAILHLQESGEKVNGIYEIR